MTSEGTCGQDVERCKYRKNLRRGKSQRESVRKFWNVHCKTQVGKILEQSVGGNFETTSPVKMKFEGGRQSAGGPLKDSDGLKTLKNLGRWNFRKGAGNRKNRKDVDRSSYVCGNIEMTQVVRKLGETLLESFEMVEYFICYASSVVFGSSKNTNIKTVKI